MSRRWLLVYALAGLAVGLLLRPSPSPVAAAEARPATPESRRLVERVAARRAEAPRREHPVVPTFLPRAEGEWQGMPVASEPRIECATSDTCGLARACVEGVCTACRSDGQCLAGERCALDHCVPAAAVACRTFRDCAADELCVLSGYSADARGNASMKAECLAPRGGSDVEPEMPAAEPTAPADFGDYTPPQALLDSLE